MKIKTILGLFIVCTIGGVHGNTHWMVTESGLIQPRFNSPFELARPYDLVAFLSQQLHLNDIISVYKDLSNRQALIDELWVDVDVRTDIGSQIIADDNCDKAGKLNALDWYVSFLEDGSSRNIPEQEFQLVQPQYGQDTDVPDCKKISSLTFSMFAFEHLEGMVSRGNLTASPEYSLPEIISPIMNIDQFGHWLSGVLRKNSSSWLHYNLASLYWRVRGNIPKAMECSRRSLHYAPREYKDIALLNLGTILHRSKQPEDAIIVLNAAVDHNPNHYMNHFMLGNAYVTLCDFNSSLRHLDRCLKLNPKFDVAVKNRHGVLCDAALLKRLSALHGTLHKLRQELVKYGEIKDTFLDSQSALLKAMNHEEEFDTRNIEENSERMSQLTGLDIKDLARRANKNALIKYCLEGSMFNEKLLENKGLHAVEFAHSLQRLVKYINTNPHTGSDILIPTEQIRITDGKFLREFGAFPTLSELLAVSRDIDMKSDHRQTDKKSNNQEDMLNEYETGQHLYPLTMRINRNTEDFDRHPDWPSKRFCKEEAPNFPPNVEAIFQIFMPFENKGIRLGTLLSEKIGVSASEQYELPWHPPTCPQDKDATSFTQKKSNKPQSLGPVISTGYLKHKLFEYVGNGDVDLGRQMQDAEIGQRIYAAMQEELAPKWILFTLSSLYWRTRNNNVNALHCLLTASKTVPIQYKDLVLISLASIYLEMGYFVEALDVTKDAFTINFHEPATNFMLAEMHMLKKHPHTHLANLKEVIRVEPDFMFGLARNLLNGWSCILKEVNALQESGLVEGHTCSPGENGVSLVCSKDGKNCKLSDIHCYKNHEKSDTSTMVRLLELKDENIEQSQLDNVDPNIFNNYVNNMPVDRTNKVVHQRNFDNMMQTIDKSLKGCGSRGCHTLTAEDLAMKEHECSYHQLQMSNWLHVVSYRQLFEDTNLRLPIEIVSVVPSSKKLPECRLSVDPSEDFFLERISRVDTEGWEAVLFMMHQFSEIFNYFEFIKLGAKFAKYMETKPRSWAVALGAGWWCGAGGHGACAVRCMSSALALAPPRHAHHVLSALATLLHAQTKQRDAKDIAYLSFYLMPKGKVEAFLVAISHTYLSEYEQAVWMYRYSLNFDEKFLPAKACLHSTLCLMFFSDRVKLEVV